MSATELLLIDLSGIAHQIWHVSGNEPDPSHVSTQVIARVRALASAHPHAAVCCDSGRSFRADIDPTYKANRDTENRAPLRHQMDVACETLKRDGFVVWGVKGFEADDIIATATAQAMAIEDANVLIVSDDKDLLQLVSDRVNVHRLTSGLRMDPAAVVAKLKVKPAQVADYLALLGDKSDNIVGAKGIGEKIASDLLTAHGTLKAIYETVPVASLKPSVAASLTEFKDRWPLVAQLIALRTDAPIEFSEIASERTAPPMEDAVAEKTLSEMSDAEFAQAEGLDGPKDQPKRIGQLGTRAVTDPVTQGAPQQAKNAAYQPDMAAPSRQETLPAPYAGPVDFSQQLEPRNMPEAKELAKMMFDSRLFGAYGTPQAVLATVLAGRELGIPAMASLRAFHIIEGKPQMSAGTIQSLVLKSGKARTFRCTERTATRATFITQRGDDPEMSLSYTIEEGRAAWPKDEGAWNKSGWGRNPADMLVARASSKLARLVYPDVVSGLYAPEEMD